MLGLLDELADVAAFAVEVGEAYLLQLVVGLLLIGVLHIALQVDDVAACGLVNAAQRMADVVEKLATALVGVGGEIGVDAQPQSADILPHRLDVDVFVDLEHVLEEVEVVVVQLQGVAHLLDDAVADEEAQLVLVAVEGVDSVVVTDGDGLALVEHIHKQLVARLQSSDQFPECLECGHSFRLMDDDCKYRQNIWNGKAMAEVFGFPRLKKARHTTQQRKTGDAKP